MSEINSSKNKKTQSEPKKCIGVAGRLFGHKFVKKDPNFIRTFQSDNCYRCGQLKEQP